MEKKKVVPAWLSIVLVVLCLFNIGSNIYGIGGIFSASNQSEFKIFHLLSLIFYIISSVLALLYCFKGYKKDANKIFKLCSIFLTISLLLQVAFKAMPVSVPAQGQQLDNINVEMPTVKEGEVPYNHGKYSDFIVIIFSTIMFGCMMVLCIAEDLGKKKSTILSAVIIISALTLTILTINVHNFVSVLFSVNFGVFVNAVIYGIMVYAKYQDKEARGTK